MIKRLNNISNNNFALGTSLALGFPSMNKAIGRKQSGTFFASSDILKSCVCGNSQGLSSNKSRCLKITIQQGKPGLTVAGAFKLWSIKAQTDLRGLLLADQSAQPHRTLALASL